MLENDAFWTTCFVMVLMIFTVCILWPKRKETLVAKYRIVKRPDVMFGKVNGRLEYAYFPEVYDSRFGYTYIEDPIGYLKEDEALSVIEEYKRKAARKNIIVWNSMDDQFRPPEHVYCEISCELEREEE